MGLNTRNGWGVITQQIQASSVVAGNNTVNGNVGVAILVTAGQVPVRLARLAWRVDIAPDVPAGSVNAPDKYRLVILRASQSGAPDMTNYQNSAGYANELSIPALTQQQSVMQVLWDEWLDAAVSFPGLDVIQDRAFSDAGPTVSIGETMLIALIPVIFPLPNNLPGPTNAVLHLVAYGTAEGASQVYGSADAYANAGSLPRYDIKKPA